MSVSRVHDRRTNSLSARPRQSESSSPPSYCTQGSTSLLRGLLRWKSSDQLVLGLIPVLNRSDWSPFPIGLGATVGNAQSEASQVDGVECPPGHSGNFSRREGSTQTAFVFGPFAACFWPCPLCLALLSSRLHCRRSTEIGQPQCLEDRLWSWPSATRVSQLLADLRERGRDSGIRQGIQRAFFAPVPNKQLARADFERLDFEILPLLGHGLRSDSPPMADSLIGFSANGFGQRAVHDQRTPIGHGILTSLSLTTVTSPRTLSLTTSPKVNSGVW
jgi:hypothetical protein